MQRTTVKWNKSVQQWNLCHNEILYAKLSIHWHTSFCLFISSHYKAITFFTFSKEICTAVSVAVMKLGHNCMHTFDNVCEKQKNESDVWYRVCHLFGYVLKEGCWTRKQQNAFVFVPFFFLSYASTFRSAAGEKSLRFCMVIMTADQMFLSPTF